MTLSVNSLIKTLSSSTYTNRYNMTIQYIKETIEWRSGFKFDCTSRERNRSYLRSLYYTLAREYTNNSLLAIAKLVNRDHSTAIHGLKLFEQAYSYEPNIRELYEDFLNDHPIKADRTKVKITSLKELNNILRAENERLIEENARLQLELDQANYKLDTNAI